jgi:predicted  nucleic acid-binding Zn-ribbon protein
LINFQFKEKKTEEEIIELKNHLSNSKKESDSKSVKLGELESYLKILPTADEYKSVNEMLKTAKDENEKLKNELQSTNKRLGKAKTVIKQTVSNQG